MPAELPIRGVDRGVLFSAAHDDVYLVEAFLAASSVRRHLKDVPICLATDRPDHPLVHLGPFDHIQVMEADSIFASPWVTGKFARIRALQETPYDRTLHLDCDTRVRSSRVGSVFDVLEHFDLAVTECMPDASYCRRVYGRRIYNGGVIGYRYTERTDRLLALWNRLTYRQHRMLEQGRFPAYVRHVRDEKQRRKLLRMDQISLAQILSPDVNRLGVCHQVLDGRWNERRPLSTRSGAPPPFIEHLPAFHAGAVASLLRTADQWYLAKRTGDADILYGVVRDLTAERAVPRSDVKQVDAYSGPVALFDLMENLDDATHARSHTACERGLLHTLFGQDVQARRWTRAAADLLQRPLHADLRFPTAPLIDMAMSRPRSRAAGTRRHQRSVRVSEGS